LIGAALFGVASVLAAFSRSAEMLIATRALLGIAGATVAPSTLSLIRNMFLDPHQRTVAISVWIMSFSLGAALGPLIGGVMLEFFWWGSVFLISVPVMLLLLVVGPMLLPEYRDPNAGKPDLISVVMSLAAVLSMIYGLKQIAQHGVGVRALASIVAGIVIGVQFVRRQLTLQDPLIDMRLFRTPAFTASLATYGMTLLIMFGGFFFLPQYLQLILGLSPFESGLWMLPWALAFIVGSLVTPKLARRTGPRHLMAAGLVLSTVGFLMIAAVGPTTEFAYFATATFVFSLGVAPVFTLTTDLIVGSAPPERAGAASAISETSAEFGGALGIAVFGSIGVAVYRAMVGDALPPSISPEVAEAAKATLGGAMATAAQLPGELGTTLTDAARAAFIRGVRVCAVISAMGSLALAAFVWVALRKGRPASERGAAAEPEPRAAAGASLA
jgi:DHA2 family multidrug resistance protein-like MFS transporter